MGAKVRKPVSAGLSQKHNELDLSAFTENNRKWVEQSFEFKKRGWVHDDVFSGVMIQQVLHSYYIKHRWGLLAKRAFDIFFALTALLLLSPVFIITAIACAISLGGFPVFYRDRRAGHLFQPFFLLKFCSMKSYSIAEHNALGKEERIALGRTVMKITPVGRVIRRWKIDELPQIINVLKGEMSIVGPRPISIEETTTLGLEHLPRHAFKPGITGEWQSSLPSDAPAIEKLDCDVRYIENWSFFRDIKIIFKTPFQILKGGPSGTTFTVNEESKVSATRLEKILKKS